VDTLVTHLLERGCAVLFAVVLMESIGLPVPAALALLLAGGAAGRGMLGVGPSLASALGALLLGDTLMFLIGRYTGWWLLGLLCRISLNPESCILSSADSFYKRGRILLLFAKFVPGINSLASPIAGSMNMRFWQFLALDCLGGSAYVGVYWGLGYVFSDVLQRVTSGYQAFGQVMGIVLAILVAAYIAYQVRARLRNRDLRNVPRVLPAEVAQLLYAPDGSDGVTVLDVRSHGYYEPKAMRIRGSSRLEPNALHHYGDDGFPAKQLFLYCTCVLEATSARVARVLRGRGIPCSVIDGGLRAWKKAGLPMEPVPQEDVIDLPSFARR